MAEIVSVFTALEEGKNKVYCCTYKNDLTWRYWVEGIAMAVKSVQPPRDIRNEVQTRQIDEVLLESLGNYNPLPGKDFEEIKKLADSSDMINHLGIRRVNNVWLATYLGNAIQQILPDANRFNEFQRKFTIKEGIEMKIYPRPKTSYRSHESFDIYFLHDSQYGEKIDGIIKLTSKILRRTNI